MYNHGLFYVLKVNSINFNSIGANFGINDGDFVLAYDGVFLGHLSEGENPLLFQVNKLSESSFKGARVEVLLFRDGKYYVASVPAGQLLGVGVRSVLMNSRK